MKIKKIKYGRVFNLGDYENERIEMIAYLTNKDDTQISLKQLAKEVEKAHQIQEEKREYTRETVRLLAFVNDYENWTLSIIQKKVDMLQRDLEKAEMEENIDAIKENLELAKEQLKETETNEKYLRSVKELAIRKNQHK